MKDRKVNFENKQSVRLIHPAKNEIGRISKITLDKINVAIKRKLKFNQWRNIKEVIDWFVSIDEKPLYKFRQFDITKFCPSIKEPLLEKALKFTEEYIHIPTDDEAIIKHAQKSLLFSKSETWIKKGSRLFDLAIGPFDRAEVCELVGNFLLHKLSEQYEKKNLALYYDHRLAIF